MGVWSGLPGPGGLEVDPGALDAVGRCPGGIPPVLRRRFTRFWPRANLQGTPAAASASTGALHAQGLGPCAQRYRLSAEMTVSGHPTYHPRSGRSADHGGQQQAAFCPPT